MKINLVKFSNLAITPTKGTKGLTEFDFYLVECVTIPSNSIKLIKTDIGFKIRKGYFAKTYARSTLTVRCTEIAWCVINVDYRGPIVVLFFNFFDKKIDVENGEIFCQIVFQRIANNPSLSDVDNFDEDKTDREKDHLDQQIILNMCAGKIFANSYVPEYVPKDFPWYEHEGLNRKN